MGTATGLRLKVGHSDRAVSPQSRREEWLRSLAALLPRFRLVIIPEISAAALAHYLLCQDHGLEKIRDMLQDDILAALSRGDRKHARELFMALRHFLSTHRDAQAVASSSRTFQAG